MKTNLIIAALCLFTSVYASADSMEPPPGYKPDIPAPSIVTPVSQAMQRALPPELWLGGNVEESLQVAFDAAKHTLDYNSLQGVKTGIKSMGKDVVSNVTMAVILFPSREAFLEYPGKRQMQDLRDAGVDRATPITAASVQKFVKMMISYESLRYAETAAIMDSTLKSANWGGAKLTASVEIKDRAQNIELKRFGLNAYVAKVTENGAVYYAYLKAPGQN